MFRQSIHWRIAPEGGHSKAKRSRLVLYEQIGPGAHACNWCNKQVHWQGASGGNVLVVDHLDADTWNDSPRNLVPSCPGCNVARAKRDNFLTHCSKGHPRNAENTWLDTRNERRCRPCNRLKANRRYHRMRRLAGHKSSSKYSDIISCA